MMKRCFKIFVLLACCIVFVVAVYLFQYALAICIAFLIGFMACNALVKKKQNRQRTVFGIHSNIRNVDCLIIGDIVDPASFILNGKRFIQISACDRNLRASYEILKHTSSILKEKDGEVYLVTRRDNRSNKFSVFDMQWLHPITLRKYDLHYLVKQARFPLFFAPVHSVQTLLNISKPGKILEEGLPDDKLYAEIAEFCKTRDFKLYIVII